MSEHGSAEYVILIARHVKMFSSPHVGHLWHPGCVTPPAAAFLPQAPYSHYATSACAGTIERQHITRVRVLA